MNLRTGGGRRSLENVITGVCQDISLHVRPSQNTCRFWNPLIIVLLNLKGLFIALSSYRCEYIAVNIMNEIISVLMMAWKTQKVYLVIVMVTEILEILTNLCE